MIDMYLDENAFKIENINIGQYITGIEYGHNKIWADDSGRSLSGDMSGTFLGIVWKFKVKFAPMDKTTIELLSPILDSAWQNVTFYDTNSKSTRTIRTYTGDWATLNENMFSNVAKVNESFEISFIAKKPIKY